MSVGEWYLLVVFEYAVCSLYVSAVCGVGGCMCIDCVCGGVYKIVGCILCD